ncbi:uncharacterized protein DS421_15g516450 [Arachis hypogaea]|nr:uncharacterized protein DS421_15g516450 [Arachis hypogaea]
MGLTESQSIPVRPKCIVWDESADWTDPAESADCADCARYADYAYCDDWPRRGRWTDCGSCTGCGDYHGYHDYGLVAVVYNTKTAQTLHTEVVYEVLAVVLVAVGLVDVVVDAEERALTISADVRTNPPITTRRTFIPRLLSPTSTALRVESKVPYAFGI